MTETSLHAYNTNESTMKWNAWFEYIILVNAIFICICDSYRVVFSIYMYHVYATLRQYLPNLPIPLVKLKDKKGNIEDSFSSGRH